MAKKKEVAGRGGSVSRKNRNTRILPEKGQRVALFGTKVPQLARFSVSEVTGFIIVMAFLVLLVVVLFL